MERCVFTRVSWILAVSWRWRWGWLMNSTGLSRIVWEILLERHDGMSACFARFMDWSGRASSSNI